MVAWASNDGKFGFTKFTSGKDKEVVVVLDKAPGYTATLEMNITPPKERNTIPAITPEQAAENTRRFAYEDSIRNAYVATFPTADKAKALAKELAVDERAMTRVLKEARGNHATMVEFLRACPNGAKEKALRLLLCISEKDRRDVSIDVLNDHIAAALESNDESEWFYNFVVNRYTDQYN
jgi:hypothetical protein